MIDSDRNTFKGHLSHFKFEYFLLKIWKHFLYFASKSSENLEDQSNYFFISYNPFQYAKIVCFEDKGFFFTLFSARQHYQEHNEPYT